MIDRIIIEVRVANETPLTVQRRSPEHDRWENRIVEKLIKMQFPIRCA